MVGVAAALRARGYKSALTKLGELLGMKLVSLTHVSDMPGGGWLTHHLLGHFGLKPLLE